MILGKRVLTEGNMAFRADEIWIFLPTINLEIQRAAFIRGSRTVTAVRTAARSHWHLDRFWIDSAEGCAVDFMTIEAAQIGMLASLVTKRSRGNSSAPARQHDLVRAHRRRQLRIEINFQFHWADQLVTHLAVLRLRRDSRISVVAGEADRVTVGNCLERSLLQPKCIADILRRFRHELS